MSVESVFSDFRLHNLHPQRLTCKPKVPTQQFIPVTPTAQIIAFLEILSLQKIISRKVFPQTVGWHYTSGTYIGSMDKQTFFSILDKYQAGTASGAEKALIEEYYRRLELAGTTELSAEEEAILKETMFQQIAANKG